MPTNHDEKLAFSNRLKLALKRSKKKVETPADLALQFNLRHRSDPITPQAAQKWITGKSLPTPDKIETLATWLNISAQWLRYGIPEAKPAKSSKPLSKTSATKHDAPNATELKLLLRIRNLPESRRELIVELVEQFSIEQEIWHI
jgi:transcriptional regulator with XRE-family HTH domain